MNRDAVFSHANMNFIH